LRHNAEHGTGRPTRRPVPSGPVGRETATAVSVESEEAFALSAPVVPMDASGAHRLGWAYWEEVERTTRRLVRPRATTEGVELRLLRGGPVLLRFGHPELEVRATFVSCSYPIRGGLLARGDGGVLALALAQERAGAWCLRTSIRGFFPRLGTLPGRPGWTGFLYAHVQARLHRAVARRYVAHLVRGARP
jgi:hypothetical protein